MLSKTIILFCSFLIFIHSSNAYRDVILMHGLFGSSLEFLKLENYIQKVHPGTKVKAVNAYDAMSSLRPMWDQTNKIRDEMQLFMDKSPNGTHLICYSQGGLICRAVLQTLPNHNVHSFISLSSPQGGQYGDTKFLKYLFPKMLKAEMYKFFYTSAGQKVSIGNYWNDPHHQDLYMDSSVFLAVLNNQSATNHSLSQEFKRNFARLENLILVGGPDDEVITPWQSSHFAAYDGNETVQEMRKQPWYIDDSFGLQTLDKRNAVTTYSIPGLKHLDWPRNYTVFQNCIEKWLD